MLLIEAAPSLLLLNKAKALQIGDGGVIACVPMSTFTQPIYVRSYTYIHTYIGPTWIEFVSQNVHRYPYPIP